MEDLNTKKKLRQIVFPYSPNICVEVITSTDDLSQLCYVIWYMIRLAKLSSCDKESMTLKQ